MAEKAQPFVCGGLSACLASSVVHPIDLAKTRIQLFAMANPGVAKPSFPKILADLIKNDGVTAIYAGISASILRQAIYGTARLGLFRVFSDKLIEKNAGQSIPFYQKVLAGMGSGAIAVTIGTPCDVTLIRMQADSMKPEAERRNYKHVGDALVRVIKEEGVKKLWRGVEPSILRGMAMNAGMLATYDQSKEVFIKLFGDADPSKPSMATKLSSSATAGLVCSITSLPFDLIKSRLQDMKPDPVTGKNPYTGLAHCASSILKTEGVLSFWTGFGAYYMRTAPHAMIALVSLESFVQIYKSTFGLNKA